MPPAELAPTPPTACACPGPGDCPLRGRAVNAREYALCRGTVEAGCTDPNFCAEAAAARRRVRWWNERRVGLGLAPHLPPAGGPPLRHAPEHGPGTEQKQVIKELGFDEDCAACDSFARLMNLWGPAGCRRRRDEIVAHLREKAAARGWAGKARAFARATAGGVIRDFKLADPYGSLVDEAIRRAEERQPPPPPAPPPFAGRRHLLYHLLPVAGNGRWQWNVEFLLPRLPLFDGVRLVAVMTEAGIPYRHRPGGVVPDPHRVPLVLDPPGEVEAAFAGHRVEFVRVPNDPSLREVASFLPLFDRLAAAYTPGDAALWAHAKGTTRHAGHVAGRWAEVMAESLLDYWPAVERVLAAKPVAGTFLKYGPGWKPTDSRSDWHYSGSWFWFRCADLFGKEDWRRIDQFWSGIEPYPSQHYHHSEAGLLFHEGKVPALNLYSDRYWKVVVEPAWARWKAEHAADRSAVNAGATHAP